MIKIHYPFVDFAGTKELFDKFTKKYNADKNLRDSLRQPHHELFYALIRQYIKTIQEHNETFRNFPGLLEIDPLKPPPLFANNVMLSNILHNSEDSAYRHLKRLIVAGVIRKVHHGMNRNYELFITPELLEFGDFQKESDIQYGYKVKKASCGLSQNRQETLKNIIIPVDKGINARVDGFIKTIITGNTEQRSEKKSKEENFPAGDQASFLYSEKIKALDEKFRDMKKAYSSWLFNLAMTLLWSGHNIFETEQDNAKQYIESNYFEHCNTFADFDNTMAEFKWRIEAAGRNLKKKGYGTEWHVYPSEYFDLNNPIGFRGTKKWFLKYKEFKKLKADKRKRKSDLEKLSAQVRLFLETPDVTTYTKCGNYVKNNIPHLILQYNASVLDNQINYSYGN